MYIFEKACSHLNALAAREDDALLLRICNAWQANRRGERAPSHSDVLPFKYNHWGALLILKIAQ